VTLNTTSGALAGELSAQILAMQANLAIVQTAITNNWCVLSMIICDQNGNNSTPIIGQRLDSANSALALNEAVTIYQNIIAALTAQLEGIT